MKMIHTSDWHLGQHFLGKSRQAEHQQFLDWLIDVAIKQKVDAIIVAGDIFDTGSPPSYARELYNQFIVKLQSTNIQLIIVGGNHDSVATLGESKELLACLNTHVIPGMMANSDKQVIVLTDSKKQAIAIVCAIPFLRARDIQTSLAGQTGNQKSQSLQQAISQHYQDIYHLAQQRREMINKKIPIIATGHLATVGAKITESVRDIYIGTLESYSSDQFPPADYIALGHIHRYQKVANNKHIRYSGSPIALSFDELNQDKNILLVVFKQDQLEEVIKIKVPCFQALHQVSGNLQEIEEQIKNLSEKYKNKQPAWLDIEVSTQGYLGDLQQRIQIMLQDLPLEILKLRRKTTQQLKSLQIENQQTLQELDPKEVFQKRLASEDWSSDQQQHMLKKINLAFAEVLSELEKP